MIELARRALRRAYSALLRPRFRACGRNVTFMGRVSLIGPEHVELGDDVCVQRDCHLHAYELGTGSSPKIRLAGGNLLATRSILSATNLISLGRNSSLSQNVLVQDHYHDYRDLAVSTGGYRRIAHGEGDAMVQGASIVIEEDCWIGYGVVITAGSEDLVIGKHSVIGANAVVNRSVPPYSVAVGNPARVIKRYDFERGQWVRV